MGKRANRLKAAARKGEKEFTPEQVISNLKSIHRRDILDLMATFNEKFQELDTEHALKVEWVIKNGDNALTHLKNSHKNEVEALKERVEALKMKLNRYREPARPKVALNADSLDI